MVTTSASPSASASPSPSQVRAPRALFTANVIVHQPRLLGRADA